MQSYIKRFIHELHAFQSTANVFNPWRDYAEGLDLCPGAPNIRTKQIERFLTERLPGASYLLVAEAIGYQGGRFTGVPLTSERIILGNHRDIKASDILLGFQGKRTSNPDHKGLKSTQKYLGLTEPTATIIWGEILKSQVSPRRIITWNTFPFHPFNLSKGALSNRTPTAAELEIGVHYVKLLLEMCPGIKVIAIGNHSAKTLGKGSIENIHVPHPANGGANRFRSSIKKILPV